MTVATQDTPEPSDDEVYEAVKTALAQLGFDELEVFDSFLFGKTAYFQFDSSGKTIKICIEDVRG